MLMEEYDAEKTMNKFREEGRAEGREEGREEGKLVTLFSLVEDDSITVEKAAQKAGMSLDDFLRAMELYKSQNA